MTVSRSTLSLRNARLRVFIVHPPRLLASERCWRTASPSGAERVQSYAVYWNEADGTRFAGRISLGATFADLEGTGEGRRIRRRIGFKEIASVRYQRGRLHLWRRNA